MPTKFSSLRLWGLASKILIVDEAHEIAGDDYMVRLLASLLEFHAAMGGSAIVMTATLPLDDRQKLRSAFAKGLGVAWDADRDPHYPSLSIGGGSAIRNFDQSLNAKGNIQVVRLGSASDAIENLTQAASSGAACVWIRNSVDEAIESATTLRAMGCSVSLLHARYTLADRKIIEQRELARFGRNGTDRSGKILIATQVVESSLDLDFDVMISDLAPMAALIQRAGRLWRHMDVRPQANRPCTEPILHVLSPDPELVEDKDWLKSVLNQGAYVYPVADQWRTASVLFQTGCIKSPTNLRMLVESVTSKQNRIDIPDCLHAAELERQGEGYAKGAHAQQNAIDFYDGYRRGAIGADDRNFPTRLGQETTTLVLAKMYNGQLVPWAYANDNSVASWMQWVLSEVSASKAKLKNFKDVLASQHQSEIAKLVADWPQWKQNALTVCVVAEDGRICEGLRYDSEQGLIFA